MSRKRRVGVIVLGFALLAGLAATWVYKQLIPPAPAMRGDAPTALSDLPLTELPVQGEGDLMAVIWSGDGGWRDLDKTIGERLQSVGVPVIGVDCLRYFWHERTPDQVASDLAAILQHYSRIWQRPRAILVGYSFGADVMPFAVNRLPEPLKQSIARISLLGLAHDAAFVIDVKDRLLDKDRSDNLPVLPEVAKLDLKRVQCVYGEDEEDSACTAPEFDRAERIKTAGGHHFDRNYEALAKRILSGAK